MLLPVRPVYNRENAMLPNLQMGPIHIVLVTREKGSERYEKWRPRPTHHSIYDNDELDWKGA